MRRAGEKAEIPLSGQHRPAEWGAYLLIALIGSAVFGRSVFFGYVYFDDDSFILKNIETLSKPSSLISAFGDLYYSSYYRPLLKVSLVIDAIIGGGAPWIYHLSNVVYHIIAGCLVFKLMLKFGMTRSVTLPASLIFMVHPVVTSSVAWIVGRNETIHAIFFLLAFISYLNFIDSGRKLHLGAHLISFLLALLTKETALIIPLMVLLHGRIVLGKWIVPRKFYTLAAGWIIVTGGWMILRGIAFAGIRPHEEIFDLSAFLPNLRVILEAAGKLSLPLRLSPYPTFGLLPTALGASVIIILSVYGSRRKRKFRPLAIFGAAWMTLFLIPTLFLRIFDHENRFDYLEYRFYGSVAGFSIFIGAAFGDYLTKYKLIRKIVLPAALISYALVAINYSSVYSGPVNHWEKAVMMSPGSPDARFNLGIVSMEVGKNPVAAKDNYLKAIELNSSNPKYHYNLGLVYLQSGAAESARIEFERTTELDPTNLIAQHNLANLYYLTNNFSAAEERWMKVLKLDPNFVYAKIRLSEIRRRKEGGETGQYHPEKPKVK